MSSRPTRSTIITWIAPTMTMVVVAFALSFALSEWVAARRRPGNRDDDPAPTG